MEIKNALIFFGLKEGFSETELKKAYKILSKKYHPDVNPLPNAHLMMSDINNAYELLFKNLSVVNFADFKNKKINEVEEIIKNNRKIDLSKYAYSFSELYLKYYSIEIEIQKDLLESVKVIEDNIQFENLMSIYNLEIKKNITAYVNKLFEQYTLKFEKLTFYNELKELFLKEKDKCLSKNTINEVLKIYLQFERKMVSQNLKYFDEFKKSVQNEVSLIIKEILDKNDNPEIKILIENLQKAFDQSFSKEIDGYKKDYIKQGDLLKIKNERIIKLKEYIKKEIDKYLELENLKLEKIERLSDLKFRCDKKIVILIDKYIEELKQINDMTKFKAMYQLVGKSLNGILSSNKHFIEEREFYNKVLEVEQELNNRFNIKIQNCTIEQINLHSKILVEALKVLKLILTKEIDSSNILCLEQIMFENNFIDQSIINYVNGKNVFLDPSEYDYIPIIASEDLLDRYGKIKPVVKKETGCYLASGFTLEQIKMQSLLDVEDQYLGEQINLTETDVVEEFTCLHEIGKNDSFFPTTQEVLSQIKSELIAKSSKFEILTKYPQTVIQGFFIKGSEKNAKKYHKSLVRLYK